MTPPLLVADVLGHDRGLDPERCESRLHLALEDLTDVDLGEADIAVSAPPMVMSCDTLRRSSEITMFSRCWGFSVGFAREIP
jgi:hypothetical protein